MTAKVIGRTLVGNRYPGRGILPGKTPDDTYTLIVYFTVGRSEDSRNRIFVREDDGLRTQAFGPSKLSDLLLIIYVSMRVVGTEVIATSDDRTDTVRDFLRRGETFEGALRSRAFESDEPNSTPRVSGWMSTSTDLIYRLSILKNTSGDSPSVQRMLFGHRMLMPGQEHLIHTYRYDGSPIPSFEGELICVSILQELEEFT